MSFLHGLISLSFLFFPDFEADSYTVNLELSSDSRSRIFVPFSAEPEEFDALDAADEIISTFRNTRIDSEGELYLYVMNEGEDEPSYEAVQDISVERPAPGEDDVPGHSLLALAKRYESPVLVFDVNYETKAFDPDLGGIYDTEYDRDFVLETSFIEGGWDNYDSGEEVVLRITPDGMKDFKNLKFKSLKTFLEDNFRAKELYRYRDAEDIEVGEIEEAGEFWTDYENDELDTGLVLRGSKEEGFIVTDSSFETTAAYTVTHDQ